MNRGLDAARGEYIGIVESDDFASRNMFKTYYSFAKRHNLDLVKSNYFEHDNSGDRPIRVFDSFKYKRVFSPIDMIEAIKVLPIIWSALYRREMIVSEQIRFTETPGASFQDTSFVQRVWFSAQRVALLPGCYLHYRVDNSNSSVQSENKVFEVCTEYATSKDFLRKDPSRYATFAPVLERMKLDTYRWNYNRIAVSRRLDFLKRWTEEVRQARDEGTLLKEQFDDYNWGIIQELLEGPEPFFEKHRDTL